MNLNLTFGKKSGQVGGGRPVFDQRQRQTRVADGALVSNPPAKGGVIFMGDIAEFDESAHTCKHMKVFELAVDLLATDTTVYIKRGNFNHVLEAGLNIMVAPTAVDGTGVGVLVGTVTATTHATAGDVYAITITAGSFSASTIEAGTLFVEAAGASSIEAAVKGVHTLTIDTKPAAGDKLSLDGVVYEYAATEGAGVYAIGSDALEAASNIEDAVSAQYAGIFSVVANNGKLIFTQLTAGIGALPVLVVTPVAVTGTLAATITNTTEGEAASGAVKMLVANPNTCFTHDIYIEETPATGGDWATGFTYAASLFNSATLIECMATPVPAGVKENLRKGYSDIRVINYV